ncbi:DUF2207 domain-containing protein [bacterium]|nr:DUF2207 domain-containing protein [bacterium]
MKNKISKIIITLLTLIFIFSLPGLSKAVSQSRKNVNYWYIKDFKTTIEINSDDSAVITENIVADCGSAKKHGIFRSVPTKTKTPDKTILNPITLISITNFKNKSIKHSTSINGDVITWKIGDPNKTISGVNNYKIKYSVKNIIREQESFDEFYWNILGNFWDLEIDNFEAKIIFPENFNKKEIDLEYYSGKLEENKNFPVGIKWIDSQTLVLEVHKTIAKENGITLSASFPKGKITHIEQEKLEKYYNSSSLISLLGGKIFLFFFIIPPFIILIILLLIKRKKEKENPFHKKSVVPQYDIPNNLDPFLIGFINKKQTLESRFITASIIRLATLNLITITENEKKKFFSSTSSLEFKKTNNLENLEKISDIEKHMYNNFLFSKGDTVTNSELKKKATFISTELKKITEKNLFEQGYTKKEVNKKKAILYIIILLGLFFISFPSFIILLIFNKIIFNNLTEKGQELVWKIKGFKMYMETAETERHKFYEKENIFMKLLPYSIAFGTVKKWAKKMSDIYGEDYIKNSFYWYSGTTAISALNIDQTISKINSISSSINSTTGSNSGSSGGGFSGGGSGGGGGGGW